jgi:hypothetical protein
MTQQNKNEQIEQQKISNLYQTLKVEQPSNELDQHILNLAQQQVLQSTTENTVLKTEKSWRRWQWPMSIAASVMFVCVIFIDQFETFTPQSTVLTPIDQSDLILNSPMPSVESAEKPLTQAQPNEGEQESALMVRSQNKDKNEVLERLTVRAEQDREQAMQAFAAKKTEERQRVKVADTIQAEKQKMLTTKTEVAEPTLNLVKINQLKQHLIAKFAQLSTLHQQKYGTLDQDNFTDNTVARLSIKKLKIQELKVEITELQAQLVLQMRDYYHLQPSWQVSDELLKLLSIEQQESWHEFINQSAVQ